MNFQKKMLAITPICCLFFYLLIGFTVGVNDKTAWGWGLLVFLLVPIMPYLVGTKKIVFTITLGVTLLYVLGCAIAEVLWKPIWHPAWIIFILIPVIKIIALPNEEEKAKQKEKDDNVYEAK